MEGSKKFNLQTVDWIIIGIVMAISAGIGVYYRFSGGKQKTAEEYFKAGKSMGIVPLGIALMVSFVSAVSILGISAEVYTYGAQFMLHWFGVMAGTVAVAYLYLPVFFELNTMSVYEYLERRFGPAARLTTSIANFCQLTLYSGVVLYAPSLALEATMGLSSTKSILVIAAICMFYSSVGGMKAVLVTDIFQAVLMFGSLVCILAVASSEIDGGLANVWSRATEGGHTNFFDFRIDPTLRMNFWNLMLGGFILCCSLYGVNQVEVQRLMTVNSLKAARTALFVNMPLLIGFGWMTSFCGMTLYALYRDCNPRASGEIKSFDRIMPFFAATKMSKYPGLVGLFISGIFSASLSTISAMLNSLAAVFLEDYVKRVYKKMNKEFPTERAPLFGKILAIVIGCATTGMAFIAGSFGSLVQLTLTIMGAICGPVLGIFTLGIFFEKANEKGAILGMVSALMTLFWARIGQPRPKFHPPRGSIVGCNITNIQVITIEPPYVHDPAKDEQYFYLYRISYMWYSTIGLTMTLVIGYTASLIFRALSKESPIEPDPSLFTPFIARRIRRRRADATKTPGSQLFALEESINVNGRRATNQ